LPGDIGAGRGTLAVRGEIDLCRPAISREILFSSGQTISDILNKNIVMSVEPRIVGVDRLHDGVVISFDDGKTVIYPSAILHEILNKGEDITNFPNPADDDN